MQDFDIRDYDFTEAAWESMYDAVDDSFFSEQDAVLIYRSLKNRLKFISFGEYLKRYIYLKAELTGTFSEIDIKEYQSIIKYSFSETHTPPSFTPTTAKLSALSKNWLTQQTVKRNVVFLLGFGLNMSVEDVNTFLTKALREPEINPKNPFEVICWYCYKKGYNYLKFQQLWEKYQTNSSCFTDYDLYDEHTIGIRNTMNSIRDDRSLFIHLSQLKTKDNTSYMSVTAKESFMLLYNDARDIVADLYNQSEDEQHSRNLADYRNKLSNNERLYDYEKIDKIKKFSSDRHFFTRNDITESDIEHIICASIPTDRHGNLTPSKASKLNEQFAGKRFSRQRISEILAGATEVNRFDLITLNFFIYSQKLNEYSDAKQRYSQFLDSTNALLEKCSMGKLYIQNPYECFVLMCILTLDPLGTYADVWELSYDPEE